MSLEELQECSGIEDFQRLDRELDHLRELGLIGGGHSVGGFNPESTEADVTPTALALQMYARCNGWINNPLDFFKVSVPINGSEESAT